MLALVKWLCTDEIFFEFSKLLYKKQIHEIFLITSSHVQSIIWSLLNHKNSLKDYITLTYTRLIDPTIVVNILLSSLFVNCLSHSQSKR